MTTLLVNSEYINELQDRVAKAESELLTLREQSRWIPVSERLPEKDTTEQWEMYECKLNRYGEIKIAPLWFIGGFWCNHPYPVAVDYTEFVTHWRPLPSAPSEVE